MLGVKLDILLVLRKQFSDYMGEPLYQHALEHLEAARPDFFFVSTHGKCLTIIDLFEGL